MHGEVDGLSSAFSACEQVKQEGALGLLKALKQEGYALSCCSYPKSDLVVELQDEDDVRPRKSYTSSVVVFTLPYSYQSVVKMATVDGFMRSSSMLSTVLDPSYIVLVWLLLLFRRGCREPDRVDASTAKFNVRFVLMLSWNARKARNFGW